MCRVEPQKALMHLFSFTHFSTDLLIFYDSLAGLYVGCINVLLYGIKSCFLTCVIFNVHQFPVQCGGINSRLISHYNTAS